MVEKCITGGICNSIHRYAKANNKYMKNYDKNKESSYLNHWDLYNLNGWVMSQKLPTFNFKWVKDISQFNEDFIKNYDEKVKKDIFLKLMLNMQKNYLNFIVTYHFYLKGRNLKFRKVCC